jgi:hypothetical protein
VGAAAAAGGASVARSASAKLAVIACVDALDAPARALLDLCETRLASLLGRGFRARSRAQMYAVLLAFEATRDVNGGLPRDVNLERSGVRRPLDLAGLLRHAAETFSMGLSIRVGGFPRGADFGFLHRGLHPGFASLSVLSREVALNGWPVVRIGERDEFPPTLEAFRAACARYGALHRPRPSPVEGFTADNGFGFALGELEAGVVDHSMAQLAGNSVRQLIAAHAPVYLRIAPEDVRVIACPDGVPARGRADSRALDARLAAALLEEPW